jgi:dipeptidase
MTKSRFSLISLLGLVLAIATAAECDACTIVAVGKNASSDGSVILSHTDCGPDCRIRVVQEADHRPGEMADVHWGILDILRPLDDFGEVIGQIPQAEHTFAYFHSAYPHMNEHQLDSCPPAWASRKHW